MNAAATGDLSVAAAAAAAATVASWPFTCPPAFSTAFSTARLLFCTLLACPTLAPRRRGAWRTCGRRCWLRSRAITRGGAWSREAWRATGAPGPGGGLLLLLLLQGSSVRTGACMLAGPRGAACCALLRLPQPALLHTHTPHPHWLQAGPLVLCVHQPGGAAAPAGRHPGLPRLAALRRGVLDWWVGRDRWVAGGRACTPSTAGMCWQPCTPPRLPDGKPKTPLLAGPHQPTRLCRVNHDQPLDAPPVRPARHAPLLLRVRSRGARRQRRRCSAQG